MEAFFQFFYQASPSTLFFIFGLPLILITSAVAIIVLYLDKKRHQAFINSGILEIDTMSGHRFEEYLKELFELLGFKAKVVGSKGGDFGGDILVTKGDKRYIIQAKRYKRNVGNDAVQQAIAATTMYKAQKALVITNSTFTPAAWKQAKGGYVTLWDRKRLLKVLKAIQSGKDPETILHPQWLSPL